MPAGRHSRISISTLSWRQEKPPCPGRHGGILSIVLRNGLMKHGKIICIGRQDKKTLKKINELIKDIDRNGLKGIGKSEPLKYRPVWSRRIDQENRLVFDIKDDELLIASCRGHYDSTLRQV